MCIRDRIEGMELGADAYLEKPFSVEYLQACASSLIQNLSLIHIFYEKGVVFLNLRVVIGGVRVCLYP